MKKNVLIVYPFINQTPLVSHMVMNLRKNGINVDAINSKNFKYVSQPIQKTTSRLKIISFFWNLPVPKIKNIIFKVINVDKELLKVADRYDLIDFHFLSKDYDNLVKKLKDQKIIKVSLWGSDFYRANVDRRENQRIILEMVDCIQISTNAMKNDFLKYFNDFEDKIEIANFGLFQFDVITEVLNSSYQPKFKTENYKNKLMVVCGYNGSEGQQHSLIIEAIRKLDQANKDKIFLVFPITYGSQKPYINKIENQIRELNIPFLILKSHLTNTDLAKLRIEADLVINIQTTDAFSGSLQEHLFAGNLLLVGDWLPYKILDDKEVFYKKSTIPDLGNIIRDCIDNFAGYKKMTLGNKEKLHEISSWSVAGIRMSKIYLNLQ